jgi:hypothetical protein
MPTLKRASDIIHHHITVPVQISKHHFQEHVVRSSTAVYNSSYILQKSFLFSKTRQMSSIQISTANVATIFSVTFIRRNDILSQLHSSAATIFSVSYIHPPQRYSVSYIHPSQRYSQSVTFIRRNDILSQLHSSAATIFSVSYIHLSQRYSQSVTFIRRNDILSQLHWSVAMIFSISYIHPSQ